MNRIPFDLEKWQSGDYDVVTRDGRRVIYIHDTGLDIAQPIVFVVEGYEFIYSAPKTGIFSPVSNNRFDLFLTPKEIIRHRYIAILQDGSTSGIFTDLSNLRSVFFQPNAIQYVKITTSDLRGFISAEVVEQCGKEAGNE